MKCPYRKITEKQIVKRMDNEISIEISEETFADCYEEECAYYIEGEGYKSLRDAVNGTKCYYQGCQKVGFERRDVLFNGDDAYGGDARRI